VKLLQDCSSQSSVGKMARSVACLLAVALLAPCAHGQIRVMTPDWLTRDLAKNGRITGSTSTFGAPFYGERVLGRLVWGESKSDHSHCRADDYDVPTAGMELVRSGHGETSAHSPRLINIVMVRRGKCSFTTKVRVAAEKGAHAVVIVDREDSSLTSEDMHNIIVGNDGFGDRIHIPSILISKKDGNRLIDAAKRSTVIVELAWDLPTDHVVSTDMWMSSASRESLKFLKEFSAKRKVLNEVMIFQPHYVVFGMGSNDHRVYNDLCSDDTGKFCAEDPDGAGPITGRDVLDEDVRQLCIHELNKVVRSSPEHLKAGKPPVEYAEKYWDYMERLLDKCPLDSAHPQDRFGELCSESLMRQVGLDVDKVKHCVSTTKEVKLKHEQDNQAWSPRALRINGWRYSGILDADLVTRAICSGFITQPDECKQIFNPLAPYQSVSMLQLLVWLGITVALAFAVLMLYKRHLRNRLKEEVTLEVHAQMSEYSKMCA